MNLVDLIILSAPIWISLLTLKVYSIKFPQHFKKGILFSKKFLLLASIEALLAYLGIFFSLLYGGQKIINNGVNCYLVTFKGEETEVCLKFLNNYTQNDFLVLSLILWVVFGIILAATFVKNPALYKVLVKEVNLFEDKNEKKLSLGFLIAASIAVVVVIIGFVIFNDIINQ